MMYILTVLTLFDSLFPRCFQEQLERAKELADQSGQAQALGNMGITRMNLSHFEEAIGHFEQQLGCLEEGGQTGGPGGPSARERARALGNLGDCYDALGDLRESVSFHEQCLQLSLQVSGCV